MAENNRNSIYWITALFLAFVLVVGVLHGCKKDEPSAESPNGVSTVASNTESDPLGAAASLFREPRTSIQNIAKAAQTWDPSFEEWWGKPAPDFTLTDIEGKTHKLSDYRGKEVVVELWATWFPTCVKSMVPHMKELRGAFDQDDLAMLAISNEAPAILKTFATEQSLNYTVLSSAGALPAPFSDAKFIPTTFFVDGAGRIKIVGVGVVPVSDAKAIIQAK